ncbi:MAG: Holliday junction resolvase Hjc [Sulfolobaceae archaeon]
MNKQRGSSIERQIVNKFRDRGFAVVRTPASGSKRKDHIPDIILMKSGVIILIEMKSRRREGRIYISKEQGLGIAEFARKAGAELFIGVKYPKELYFIKFENLKRTDNGNFLIDEEVLNKALTFDELVRYVDSKLVKPLDYFITNSPET